MRKIICLIVAGGVALVLLSCTSATHQIADGELAPEKSGKTYSDLLIIGAYNDRPYRISSETTFSEILKNKGIMATPSYDLLPQLDGLENDKVLVNKLERTNHDGVLVVATLDEGYDYDVGDYYATRGMVYLLGGRPGAGTDMGAFIAWASSGQYSLYVGLWDSKTLKPVWQIKTNSQTTGSESEDSKALAEFVVETLHSKGLLK